MHTSHREADQSSVNSESAIGKRNPYRYTDKCVRWRCEKSTFKHFTCYSCKTLSNKIEISLLHLTFDTCKNVISSNVSHYFYHANHACLQRGRKNSYGTIEATLALPVRHWLFTIQSVTKWNCWQVRFWIVDIWSDGAIEKQNLSHAHSIHTIHTILVLIHSTQTE